MIENVGVGLDEFYILIVHPCLAVTIRPVWLHLVWQDV